MTRLFRNVAGMAAVALLWAGFSLANGPSLIFGPPYTITGGFLRPYGVAVDDAHGRLLVADTANRRFLHTAVADLTGSYTFTAHGFVADPSDPAALQDPQAIAADAAGNVYVVNTLKGAVKLYLWNGGNYQLDANFASSNPHVVAGTPILLPRDIAVGADGAVYLLDSGNKRILKASGPADTSWEVFKSDASWSNPYGLDIDASGAIFLADTDHHRILKIVGSTTTEFGSFGVGLGQLRFPRDVAVDQHGRIFVADTYNHRIQIFAADGHPIKILGHAPGIATLEKVVVDSSDRVFAVDSDSDHVLAFLGAGQPAPFDPYFRDFLGDPGGEPSNLAFSLASPDILVRHNPDVDLAAAASAGLESFAFQQPQYEQLNYVYIQLNNRGTQTANDNFVKVYWFDPGTPGKFPQDWKDAGFYSSYTDDAHNSPGNTLQAPSVVSNGRTVLGPLIWKPPAPQSALAGDGLFRLGVRVTNPFDFPPVGDSTTMARDSNNVAQRNVAVIQGPFPAGEQNTLVATVRFPDLAGSADEAVVQARISELAAWIEETSWGEANVNPLFRGPVTLPHNQSHYENPSNSLLVEMAEDALALLLAGEPNLLDGSGPGHEIGRLILVTNDLDSEVDWATTGAWPYTTGGKTRYLTVSVQGGNNSGNLFAHGMSHQLNMLDLYAHENVTFSRPYVDGWDNMAKPFNGAHPLVWSKEFATWVTTHNAKIFFVPRPAPGTLWDNGGQPVHLHFQETAAPGEIVGVAFGLTNGVTAFTDEKAFYFVEARKNSGEGAGSDSVLPQTGVLMYYANQLIPQGQGPVILRDHVPGGNLNDAAIPVGGTEAPAGTGIQVMVQNGTAGADFDLAVQYNPPATDYDVYMHAGDPPWQSPDIWVDNQQDGYDENNGNPPQDRGNQGIAGEENRVYARVFNSGPATAFDVEVAFLFSEPYHTVGGAGAFDEFKSIFIDKLDSGTNKTPYVTWTPATGVEPHTCARVELRRLFNDTNSANDMAQRNLQIDHSVHGSPYTPVEFQFMVRNEEPTQQLVYYRADGVPEGWDWTITPRKALLAPGAAATALLKLQPPEGAPDCTSHQMFVTGWVPRGDTLIRLGGVSVTVNLQQKTDIGLRLRQTDCRPEDRRPPEKTRPKPQTAGIAGAPALTAAETPRLSVEGIELPASASRDRALREAVRRPLRNLLRADFAAIRDWLLQRDPEREPKQCRRLHALGCTSPPQPNQTVILRYEGPDGAPIYHEVQTDANGCYEDFNVVVEGGNWGVTAEFPGTECAGPATATGEAEVPLEPAPTPEVTRPDPEERFCMRGFSSDVRGVVRSSRRADAKGCEGRTSAFDQSLALKLYRSEAEGAAAPLEGELTLPDLRQILSRPDKGAGLNRGRFNLQANDFAATGLAVGLTNRGTHHAPAAPGCSEDHLQPGHWELSLDGVVVKGPLAGSRLRATLILDVPEIDPSQLSGAEIVGSFEAVVETTCGLTREEIEKRVRLAYAKDSPAAPSCDGQLPCLFPIAKRGEGQVVLDQTGQNRCGDKEPCRAYKTWSRLEAKLEDVSNFEGASPLLQGGVFQMAELVQILDGDADGRGEHFGSFAFQTRDNILVRGEMIGTTRVGSHRKPCAKACESADEAGHLEGRLAGVILNGPNKGAAVEARYVLQIGEEKGRRRPLSVTLEGWGLRDCFQPSAETRPPEPPDRQPTPPDRTEPPRPAETGGSVRIVEKLPDDLFRPLSELPRRAVERFTAAEGGRLTPDGERRLRMADRRFRELDQNSDQRLNEAEFSAALGGAEAGRLFAENSLGRLDKNQDGAVDRREAGEGWKTLGLLDSNRDGRVVRSELVKAPEIFGAREFREADLNRDGAVDFTEYALRSQRRAKEGLTLVR